MELGRNMKKTRTNLWKMIFVDWNRKETGNESCEIYKLENTKNWDMGGNLFDGNDLGITEQIHKRIF